MSEVMNVGVMNVGQSIYICPATKSCSENKTLQDNVTSQKFLSAIQW